MRLNSGRGDWTQGGEGEVEIGVSLLDGSTLHVPGSLPSSDPLGCAPG
jgi:hypothetical protein